MAISSLKLQNFRSYRNAEFSFSPKLNLVIGKNGAGKTNLLESLYVLSAAKSWRASDRQLTHHDQDFWRIEAKNNGNELELSYQQPTKRLKLNGRTIKPTNYLGRFPCVLFEPGSLNIVVGSPEDRRRFINGVLINTSQNYLTQLLRYRQVLRQRNALLRSRAASLKQQIFAWDIKLVEAASYLYQERLGLVDYLNQAIPALYKDVSGKQPGLSVNYLPSVPEGDYNTRFLEALAHNVDKDLMFGHTTIGIHRDDLGIVFKNKPVASLASRGEVRSIASVFKLAETMFIKDRTQKDPLLLLDDVLSELDQSRQSFLLKSLGASQTVITATDATRVAPPLRRTHNIIRL